MEEFVTKSSILDVAVVLDPPLHLNEGSNLRPQIVAIEKLCLQFPSPRSNLYEKFLENSPQNIALHDQGCLPKKFKKS